MAIVVGEHPILDDSPTALTVRRRRCGMKLNDLQEIPRFSNIGAASIPGAIHR
jgi:hypothetical protein